MSKMIKNIFVTLIVLTLNQALQAQVAQESIFSRNQKFDHEGVELYDSNLDLKSFKKIGFGLSTGGLTGLLGINLEVNVANYDAIGFGVGAGKAFNSFHLVWKRNYKSAYLSPYTKVGYSNWFNSSSSGGSANDSDVLKRVLTSDEIKDNKFSSHFIAAGAGLEYNQLEGELSGLNFYGELFVMSELKTSIYLPTAGIGLTYFY